MTRVVAALLALGLLAPGVATNVRAADLEFFTGANLADQCAANPGDAEYAAKQGRCVGYVVGVSDSEQAGQGAGGAQKVCLPAGVTADKMVLAFTAFLTAHPDKKPLAAQDVVIEALAAQFPCK